MTATLLSPHQHLPLEADWVERPLSLVVDGVPVTGFARANWGASGWS